MKRLLVLQGIFYFVMGIWPLVHMSSFLAVTGEKTDFWLVRTVGGLLAISGLAFLFESQQKKISKSLIVIAIGEAFLLALIDVIYVSSKVISPIYLLDGAVEAFLILIWVFVCARNHFAARSFSF